MIPLLILTIMLCTTALADEPEIIDYSKSSFISKHYYENYSMIFYGKEEKEIIHMDYDGNFFINGKITNNIKEVKKAFKNYMLTWSGD